MNLPTGQGRDRSDPYCRKENTQAENNVPKIAGQRGQRLGPGLLAPELHASHKNGTLAVAQP